jgi:hypothetical protein
LASTLLTEPEEPSLCRRVGVRGYTVELGLMICLPATAVGSHYAGRAACRSLSGSWSSASPVPFVGRRPRCPGRCSVILYCSGSCSSRQVRFCWALSCPLSARRVWLEWLGYRGALTAVNRRTPDRRSPTGLPEQRRHERGRPRGSGARGRQEGLQHFSHEVPHSGLRRIVTEAALLMISVVRVSGLGPSSRISIERTFALFPQSLG